LIDLLAVTDMRIGEAIGLNRNDFDASCGVLTIRNGKFGKSRVAITLSTIAANEQGDGSGFAVEPHPHHGAVERLAVVGSDYPPTVARLATAWTERITGHCLPKNLKESGYDAISCTGGGSLSIWLRSSPRCWRGAKAQEKS
jgi:hypothetical protein